MGFFNWNKKEKIENTAEVKEWNTKFFLEPSTSYLIKEKKSEKSFEIFFDHVNAGKKGLAITRINPNRIKQQYNVKDSMIMWLTELEEENCVEPSPVEKLNYIINEFLEKNQYSVVILDGIEYLSCHNSFEKVLVFLQGLKDMIEVKKSNLIVPVNSDIIKEQDMKLLEREFEVYEER